MADARKGAGRRSAGKPERKGAGKGDGKAVKIARGFRFGAINYALLAAGLAAIVLGYVLLDAGSVTAAPFLLILGYVVLLPLGILFGWKKLESTSEDRSPP